MPEKRGHLGWVQRLFKTRSSGHESPLTEGNPPARLLRIEETRYYQNLLNQQHMDIPQIQHKALLADIMHPLSAELVIREAFVDTFDKSDPQREEKLGELVQDVFHILENTERMTSLRQKAMELSKPHAAGTRPSQGIGRLRQLHTQMQEYIIHFLEANTYNAKIDISSLSTGELLDEINTRIAFVNTVDSTKNTRDWDNNSRAEIFLSSPTMEHFDKEELIFYTNTEGSIVKVVFDEFFSHQSTIADETLPEEKRKPPFLFAQRLSKEMPDLPSSVWVTNKAIDGQIITEKGVLITTYPHFDRPATGVKMELNAQDLSREQVMKIIRIYVDTLKDFPRVKKKFT